MQIFEFLQSCRTKETEGKDGREKKVRPLEALRLDVAIESIIRNEWYRQLEVQ